MQSGQFNYAVYGRTTSGYTLLGFSVPGQLYWNDWGATMSGNLTAYGWLPTTAPSSAQNGVLTTTITAGGGTTNVTLAAAAGNSASGAFVTFDDAPGFIAAMASDPGETTIYIPPPAFFYNFIIGSYLPMINTTFGLRAAVVHQAGGLYLDDPVEIDNGGAWFGESGYSQEQAQQTYQAASVTVGTAYPGFYLNGSNVELDRLSVSQYPGCNNALLAYANTAGGSNNILTWNHSVLQTGTGSCSSNNDYLGIAFYDDGVSFTNLSGDTFNGGPVEAPNLTTTPLVVYQGNVANDTITDSQFDRRGIASARDTTGGGCQLLIKGKTWSQGPIEPLYSCNAIQNEIGGVDFESSLLDTSGQPIFANLSGGTFEGTVRIFSANTDSPYNTITGAPVANLTVTDCSTGVSAINGGGFGQNQDYSAECVGLTEPTNATYGTVNAVRELSAPIYQAQPNPQNFFIEQLRALPSLTESAGGSLTGTQYYGVVAHFPNGTSRTGPMNNVTMTGGNGTVVITGAAVPGATSYDIWGSRGLPAVCTGVSTPSCADTGGTLTASSNNPTAPSGGCPAMTPSGLFNCSGPVMAAIPLPR